MDDLGLYVHFNIIFSYIRTMGGGGDNEKYICNGTPFTFEKKILSVAGYKPGLLTWQISC